MISFGTVSRIRGLQFLVAGKVRRNRAAGRLPNRFEGGAMDRDAILALARAAQASQQSLETFVDECFRQASQPAGVAARVLTKVAQSAATAAGRAAADVRGQITRRSPFPGLPVPPPLSADFYSTLAGGALNISVARTRQAMTDFLMAVRDVWSPSAARVIGLLLRQRVRVVRDRDLIAYRVYFGILIAELWHLPLEELARQALRMESSARTANQCTLLFSISMIMVAVIVAVITASVTASVTWGAASAQIFIAVAAATDASLVTAVVILINSGVMMVVIARVLIDIFGLTGERVASILCAASKCVGAVTAAVLDVLVSVLKYEVYTQAHFAQTANRRIAQDLMAISVSLEDIVAALRRQQASEADLAKALKDLQGASASNIAAALKSAGSSFADIARALKDAGFSTNDLADALAHAFGWSRSAVQGMLHSLGL
jgi:hypothetical protein